MRRVSAKLGVIAVVLIGAALLIGGNYALSDRNAGRDTTLYAAIYQIGPDGNKLVERIPLEDGGGHRIIPVKGPLGVTHVEVDGARVRVLDSPCPDQVCVMFGWLDAVDDFSACLPNGVLVVVEGPGGPTGGGLR